MKLTQYNIVYTGITAIGVSANPTVVGTAAANVGVIPLDTRSNPVNVWGSIIDGGASTYAVQYTTSDVYAPGYNAATDPQWTAVPSGPVGGSKPFNLTAVGATGIRLNVTVGPATVTLGPIFQSDSTVGA
jgi:hypothetical protein